MRQKLSLFAAMLLCAGAASAAGESPADIAAPPGAGVVREVQAGGVQIYACRATSTGTFAWVLTGPKAILVDADGSDFGTHGVGPRWTATDGSAIVADGAHPLAKVERPDGVAALLLSVVSSTGSGVLSGVRFVRRWDTSGGLPPATVCDASSTGATVARHYSAVYTFYR